MKIGESRQARQTKLSKMEIAEHLDSGQPLRSRTEEQAPDFSEINDKNIGYKLKVEQDGRGRSVYSLQNLTFRDFIKQYSQDNVSDWDIWLRVEGHLEYIARNQGSAVGGQIMLDAIATAALQREATTNAIKLIKEHYLNWGD